MKKLIILSIIVAFSFTLFSCSNGLIKEKRGDETVIGVNSEDVEMNLIIENARKSVKDFLKEMNDPNTKWTEFSVKYPFDTDPGSEMYKEHIWLMNIESKDNKYYGIVANDPFYIKSMKLGDLVEFDINMISDWKYVKDGYLVGGESIKYFYNRMTDDEQVDFEKEAGFKIKSN